MHGVEQALDRATVLPFEHLERQVDGDRVLLAHIAHVGRAFERDLPRFDRGAGDGCATLALEVAVDAFDRRKRRVLEPREPSTYEIVTEIREQHAEGGERSEEHTSE